MSDANREPNAPEDGDERPLVERLDILKRRSGVKNDTQFARLAGVARSSMSAYLNGKAVPRAAVLHKLAKAIPGTDINWLLGTPSASVAVPMLPGQDIPLLLSETLDAPVNFYLLVVSAASCKDYFRNREKPTLRTALQWMSGPYAIHGAIADADFLVTAPGGE